MFDKNSAKGIILLTVNIKKTLKAFHYPQPQAASIQKVQRRVLQKKTFKLKNLILKNWCPKKTGVWPSIL